MTQLRYGRLVAALGLLAAFTPSAAFACACGCAVFDVGTRALLPDSHGSSVFVEYDFMDQNRNWSGTHSAPAANNDDIEIKSNFFTLGTEKMFADGWGVMAEVPVTNRLFTTNDGGNLETHDHTSFGDIRLMGMYSGFSDDMSTTAFFGVKLPTGDFNITGFDRDTAIGSGSTDLLLGLAHTGTFSDDWGWYGQAMWNKPLATQGGYTPGAELDGALGVYYLGYTLGEVAIVPTVQAIASIRARDGGASANPPNTGYSRLLLSPGIEVDYRSWRAYGDVELPVYQNVNGNQLVARALFKFAVSYRFGD